MISSTQFVFLILFQRPNNANILDAAKSQIGVTLTYDPAYARLKFPGGDVPKSTGVCTDVVIRSLRSIGVDLQKEIYNDRKRNPSAYGGGRPDPNIDHRRVKNQMIFFNRRGKAVVGEFRPGDIVAWELPNKRLHIGIVAERGAIHNIGSGIKQEDVLNAWKKIGHYRL
jgi:uncharacterized protein YijF (DUF1287 family)